MFSWKDKVTEKLSHLFSDSASSASPALDQPQARPFTKEGGTSSSIFSFIIPPAGFDGSRSRNSRCLSSQDKPLDSYAECDPRYENGETPNSHEEYRENGSGRSVECKSKGELNAHEDYGDSGSGRSTSGSDMFEDATDSHNMEKSMPYLTEDSSFISPDLYEFLQSSIPNIVKGCQWVLLYSTIKHGISLRTLIRRSADLSGPCLLIVGDMQGAVLGGLLECPLKPTAKRKYQGTNQTFVFTTIYGEPRIFRPTGANRYFYLCLNDLLALGGGGNFALCLDGDLLTGTSGPCETFGNLCLAHSQEFELKNVELWGFKHLSQYLT
ncbi:hypothetical protein F0562_000562 [Nyssa sinensis]|uniref:TLDc domain-containing protein n=1 Tax=Nyssa sinensis TaxID=561372 RepID=A0A5J5C0T6_9ASTE|nr:hypothetical protein F0562_000562 [Nyssa sinensis]